MPPRGGWYGTDFAWNPGYDADDEFRQDAEEYVRRQEAGRQDEGGRWEGEQGPPPRGTRDPPLPRSRSRSPDPSRVQGKGKGKLLARDQPVQNPSDVDSNEEPESPEGEGAAQLGEEAAPEGGDPEAGEVAVEQEEEPLEEEPHSPPEEVEEEPEEEPEESDEELDLTGLDFTDGPPPQFPTTPVRIGFNGVFNWHFWVCGPNWGWIPPRPNPWWE